MSDRQAEIAAIIDQIPIFADLSTNDVAQLATFFRFRKWAAGETIFSEGENSHDLYFLVTGAVAIRKRDKNGVMKDIAKLEGKNVLGEAAFVDNSLRSATAVALGDTIGITMGQDHLNSICEYSPMLAIKLLKKINRLLALKLRKTSKEYADVVAAQAAAKP